ncbi:MAG: AAA family ATPase [Micrococcales bacterium]|nr:AAA family ATPase [Micrococcales bacterium]
MAATIQINLLGGVEISSVDAAHWRASSRAVSLLAYLVMHADRPQPRAHLAEVLWPDSESGQARTNLRRELHHLRSLLGDSACLRVEPAALVWLTGADCVVDVHEFVTACRSAVAAVDAEERDGVERHGGAALALYRGPFLPGCYDDWALTAREELDRACVDLCDRVATYWQTHDDPVAAAAFARRRVQLAPLEEQGYRLLMRAQRSGRDRAGAMRTYHQCASLLERELGVAPSPETRAELDATLADAGDGLHAVASGGGPDLTVGGAGARWSWAPDLVGREAECARLLTAWEAAQAGGRFLVVAGEAGIGKTRLVAELAGVVRRQGAFVATTRCFAASRSVPLAPVADWLRSPHLRMAVGRLDPAWRTEVDRLVPDGEQPPTPATGVRAKVDAWQRLRFFEGLARAFVAVDGPTLLIVDDLQWCDRATLSWLSFLMSFADHFPLLVVATARDEELESSELSGPLNAMRAGGQAEIVSLDSLSAQGSAELASGVLGHPVSADELTLMMSATGGNPFYLLEALRAASSTPGEVESADLQGVLTGRLSRLSEPAREVVSLASAVGRDFTLDVLIEASDLEESAVVRLVDDLWRRRVLEERGRGYDFAHDLLREAAYQMVSPPRRWLLHRRLAQALELLYADNLDTVAAQLAEQHDRSGRPERALPFYERAARRATALFAHAESVRLWQRCLDLIHALPASRSRDQHEIEVLQELLPPMNAWRGYASAELETYERRTEALGERLGLVEVRCTAAIALFTATFVQGRIAESHEWGKRAMTWSQQRPELAAQAHLALAGSGLGLGLLPLADEHFRLACDLAGESDSLPIGTRTEVHARGWRAHTRWLLGDEVGAAAASAEAVQRARLIDHPYSLTVALSYAAVTHQLLDEVSSLGAVLDELARLCDRYSFAYYGQWATVLTGWAEGGAPGLRTARRGIEALEQERSLTRMPYWLWLAADLHRRDGDAAAATALLDAAASFATEHEDRWWLPEVLRTRAALEPGPRARRLVERAMAWAESQSSITLLERCRADLTAYAEG